MHVHSPRSGLGTQTLLQLFGALGKYGAWMVDAGCMSDYLCVRLLNKRINISQDLLQAGETNVLAGRATMLVSVLLGTHHMHR